MNITKHIVAAIIFLLPVTFHCAAQNLIPFRFTSDDENKLIRENDSVKYYSATDDTAHIVALSEEPAYYKLMTRDKKVIVAEGAFIIDGEKNIQDGKWTERFDNGKTRIAGTYHKGRPVGTWMEYYNTGKPRVIYNYGLFLDKSELSSSMSGSYNEYYPSGKLKVSGFYAANLAVYYDTILVTDPVTGSEVRKTVKHRGLNAEKAGHWEYYTEDGELEKKEDF